MHITSLPPEIIAHCGHLSSSARDWAAMRRVCRAWNDSLKTLPGSVWKEWALQRFARLRLIALYWQDQDWKQVYQQQLVAERRGVPDCAHQTRRSLGRR